MAFLTDSSLRAWRFDDLDPEILGSQNGWKLEEAPSKLAALRQKHADPAWIDATLARLAVPSLAILAALVRAGGERGDAALLDDAELAHGIPKDVLRRGIGPLLHEVLIVGVGSRLGSSFALVEPSAALLAARLRDVDLPQPAIGEPVVPSERADDARALIAVCAGLGHVDIKLTQAGMPHRAAVKRLAKSIGLDEDALEHLVVLGLELAVLAANDDDVVRPVLPRLRDLACGRIPPRLRMLAAFVDELRAAGAPVSNERVARWMDEAAHLTTGWIPHADSLGSIPGICRGSVGQLEVVAAIPLAGIAAASITPSFEVFIPPESRHEHLADVLACAELVRVDRVVVARITKAAVQRAAATGATATSLLASLGGLARTPVPHNVASAIADWAGGQFAATASGRVVVVPVAEEARAVAQLAPFAPSVVAPGVIVVSGDTSARAVTSALARLGITTRTADVAEPEPEPDRSRALGRLPSLASGDPAIRDRLASYRAGDAAERTQASSHGAAGPIAVSDHAFVRVEGWEDARGCTLTDEVASVLAALLDAVPEVDQRYLLAAKNARQIAERLEKVLTQRGGLAAFVAKNRDLVKATVGFDLGELVGVPRASAGGGGPTGVPGLAWYSADLRARLVAAARTCSSYVLDLGRGRTPTVRVTNVIERGHVTMVLGEDVETDATIAVPLTTVVRIADPPATPPAARAGTGAVDARSSPWRPVEGQKAPSGHESCPCGSGVRYRACCRPKN